jgi:hypothetical protein
MTKTTELYEWLARWRGGQLSGYHVQLVTRYTDDDGTVIAEKISEALTPAQAEAEGFSLEAILQRVHTDALKLADALRAEMAEKEAAAAQALADAQAAHEQAMQALRDESAAEIQRLNQVVADQAAPEEKASA